MARPSLADRLRHILDAIADIETFTAGKTFDDYQADHMRRHAIERCLEIISEASRYVPREAKAVMLRFLGALGPSDRPPLGK